MKKFYLASKIYKSLEIKKWCFSEWLKHGFIKASIPADGQGTRSYFSVYDYKRIKIFKHLVDTGMVRKIAGRISNKIKDNDLMDLNYIVYFGHVDKIFKFKKIESMKDFLNNNEFGTAIILNIGRGENELQGMQGANHVY